jgi:hypothetical protein
LCLSTGCTVTNKNVFLIRIEILRCISQELYKTVVASYSIVNEISKVFEEDVPELS